MESERDNANAFIFSATINKNFLQHKGKGLYFFDYKCNYDKLATDLKFLPRLPVPTRCNICTDNPAYIHRLLLIDVEKFLSDKKDLYLQEYISAKRDSEWLLMPFDPMSDPNSKGFQSRIQIANFWTVYFYRTMKK